MDLNSKLSELKYDYTRLQNDLEKRESLHQDIDPLLKQLENLLYTFKIKSTILKFSTLIV